MDEGIDSFESFWELVIHDVLYRDCLELSPIASVRLSQRIYLRRSSNTERVCLNSVIRSRNGSTYPLTLYPFSKS